MSADLEREIADLKLKQALLQQKSDSFERDLRELKGGINRGLWILGGGFITAMVTWIINGGFTIGTK